MRKPEKTVPYLYTLSIFPSKENSGRYIHLLDEKAHRSDLNAGEAVAEVFRDHNNFDLFPQMAILQVSRQGIPLLQPCHAACIFPFRTRAIITINRRLYEPGRKCFAIAHELGHFELHHDTQLVIGSDEDMYAWNQSQSQEIEANEFASCILMPEAIFSRYVEKEAPNMDKVSELSGKFGTTLTATAIQFTQLSPEPCAVAISKNCILKWYKKSDSFDFHLKVGEELNPDTYAFDFLTEANYLRGRGR